MRKYIYLFELDSVRKTYKEIIKGQNALIDEIIYKGNIVILTFNQFVESSGFYILLMDKDYKESLLKLFKLGLIKVNRYGDTRTISQYLVNSIENATDFIYSGLPLEFSQKRLIALFKRSLMYSDLSEIDYYLELISKFENGEYNIDEAEKNINKINELFLENDNKKEKIINYRCNDKKENICDYFKQIIKIKNKSSYNNGFEKEKEILETLRSMLQLIFELSPYDDIYIDPLSEKEQKNQYEMIDFINIVLDNLLSNASFSIEEKTDIEDAIKIIKCLDSFKLNKNNRSDYKREIIKKYKDDVSSCRYALGIIDLCYNFKCESSIANISKHYNVKDLDDLKNKNIDIENNSFIWDFTKRLKSYIEDTKDIPLEDYLHSSYLTLTKKERKKYFKKIIQKTKLAANLNKRSYFKYNSDNKVYSYEYKEDNQSSIQIFNSIINIIESACLIVLFYCFYYIITSFLENKLSNFFLFSNPFFATSIGLILTDFIRELIFDFISSFIPTDSKFSCPLVVVIIDFAKEILYLLLFIYYGFKKQIYSNNWNNQSNEGEDFKNTDFIEYIVPRELKNYKKWYNNINNSSLIKNDSNFYKIDNPNKKTNIEEIIKEEELKGTKYGIIYSSDYRKLIVDPVRNENNKLFPYERIIPNNENGIVIIVKCKEKFILMNQYRHPIRERQLCFPRGFCEGDSLEKDAKRELYEELKIKEDNIINSIEVGVITPDSGLTNNKTYIYFCDVTHYKNSNIEGIEEIIELSSEELQKNIREGIIIDSFTICAYYMAKEKSYI